VSIIKRKNKIFCIGENKTGTTSLTKFFTDHGYKVGDQRTAELLFDDYLKRNWKPILHYCKSAQVFQDVPFSNDYLYVMLHHCFPNAKFILSERDPGIWYNSITKFHAKLFGKDGRIPTKEDLQSGGYIYKGFIWKVFKEKFGEYSNDIYNKEHLIKTYTSRNNSIKNYFNDNPNFLVVNVSEEKTVEKLGFFLDIDPYYNVFPWENKTSEV
jgi:hypothetical protein